MPANAPKGQPSESNQYTQENYDEDDDSQGTSENKQGNAVNSLQKPNEVISGGKNLVNPPSMA